jgi:hypothetical protein
MEKHCAICASGIHVTISTRTYVRERPYWRRFSRFPSAPKHALSWLQVPSCHCVSLVLSWRHTKTKTNKLRGLSPRAINVDRGPPLVGEVSVNFCREGMLRGLRKRSPRPYSRPFRPEPLLFLPSSFTIVLTRLSGPRSRPTTSQSPHDIGYITLKPFAFVM